VGAGSRFQVSGSRFQVWCYLKPETLNLKP
jgi:hypothetical protein